VFDQSCNDAPAFHIAGVWIKEAILKSILRKRGKTLMERERIESFESMSLFFQDPAAFIFKVARLHPVLANKQNAGFVIKLDAELHIPLSPKLNAPVRERGVMFVRTVSRADRFADVGRSSQGMGQGPGINQDNFVSACF
jgi:hypothetical protein